MDDEKIEWVLKAFARRCEKSSMTFDAATVRALNEILWEVLELMDDVVFSKQNLIDKS